MIDTHMKCILTGDRPTGPLHIGHYFGSLQDRVGHLQWMKDAGFVDIDVLWKYFNFAVYGGTR